MGNQNKRGSLLFNQVLNHLHDLCLNRHVQCGGRFVRNQELRAVGQCHGDDHALLHAAGELVRVVAVPLGRDADGFQHFLGFLHGLRFRHLVMQTNDLGNLVADAHGRIQGRHGVLENHRNLFAADLAHIGFVQLHQVAALQYHLAAAYMGRWVRQDAHNGFGNRGFSCAGLTDQGQCLAAFQIEVDAVYCMDDFTV